jgi:hypothetical protein
LLLTLKNPVLTVDALGAGKPVLWLKKWDAKNDFHGVGPLT